jgi:hypothetical protein
MEYIFNEFEKKIFLAAAEGRTKSKSKKQNQRMSKCPEWAKVTGDHDIDLDFWGVVGEYYVAKHLNICPDFSISKGGDGGKVDLARNNQTIQVKTNFFNPVPVLIFNQEGSYQFKADFAVSVGVLRDKKNTIKIWGFLTKVNFEGRKREGSSWYEHDYGYGLRDCISAKDLTKLNPASHYLKQLLATPKEIEARGSVSEV